MGSYEEKICYIYVLNGVRAFNSPFSNSVLLSIRHSIHTSPIHQCTNQLMCLASPDFLPLVQYLPIDWEFIPKDELVGVVEYIEPLRYHHVKVHSRPEYRKVNKAVAEKEGLVKVNQITRLLPPFLPLS